MERLSAAQYRALAPKKPATARKPPSPGNPQPGAPASRHAPETPPDDPPGHRDAPPACAARVPLRWEVAGSLFAAQHPGAFRLVVVGPTDELPAVLAALAPLTPARP